MIEKNDTLGGCWVSAFDFTELQTDKSYYQFDEYPMPSTYPNYPNKLQILMYLKNIVNKSELHKYVYYKTKLLNSELKSDKNNKNIYLLKLLHDKKLFYIKSNFIIILLVFIHPLIILI